jgi:hypothetical protein
MISSHFHSFKELQLHSIGSEGDVILTYLLNSMSKERTQSEMSLASGSIKEFINVDEVLTDQAPENIPRTVPELDIKKYEEALRNPPNDISTKKLAIDVDIKKDDGDPESDSPLSFDSKDVPPEWLDGKNEDILPSTIGKVDQVDPNREVTEEGKPVEFDRESFKSAIEMEEVPESQESAENTTSKVEPAELMKEQPFVEVRNETPAPAEELEPFPSSRGPEETANASDGDIPVILVETSPAPDQDGPHQNDIEEIPQTDSPLAASPFPEPKLLSGMSLYVVKPHKAQDLDELDLELGDVLELDVAPENDSDFWLKGTIRSWGKRNGQQGFFPKENVSTQDPSQNNLPFEAAQELERLEIGEQEQETSPALEAVPKGTTVIAMFAYEPAKQDELALIQGQTIVVMECPEGGWWKGVAGIEDKKPVTGWFPANLVKVKEDQPGKLKNDHLRANSTPTSSTTSIDSKSGEPNTSGDRKVSWFKKLRSVNDNVLEQESDRRKRAVSAPTTAGNITKLGNSNAMVDQHGALLEVSTELLERSHESIEPFPTSSKRDSMASTKNEVVYDIKPVVEEPTRTKTRPGRTTSIAIPRGVPIESALSTPDSSKPRSRTESVYNARATIVIPNSLSPSDVMQGATDETVQDKVGAAVYKHLSDQERKRLSAVWELIQTERDYCRDLNITIEVLAIHVALHETNGKYVIGRTKEYANSFCKCGANFWSQHGFLVSIATGGRSQKH